MKLDKNYVYFYRYPHQTQYIQRLYGKLKNGKITAKFTDGTTAVIYWDDAEKFYNSGGIKTFLKGAN